MYHSTIVPILPYFYFSYRFSSENLPVQRAPSVWHTDRKNRFNNLTFTKLDFKMAFTYESRYGNISDIGSGPYSPSPSEFEAPIYNLRAQQ